MVNKIVLASIKISKIECQTAMHNPYKTKNLPKQKIHYKVITQELFYEPYFKTTCYIALFKIISIIPFSKLILKEIKICNFIKSCNEPKSHSAKGTKRFLLKFAYKNTNLNKLK